MGMGGLGGLHSDTATKKEFDKLTPRYAVISQLIAARIKNKMTLDFI